MQIFEIDGQGVKQFVELGLAFLLSAAIGMEQARYATRARACVLTPSWAQPLPFSC